MIRQNKTRKSEYGDQRSYQQNESFSKIGVQKRQKQYSKYIQRSRIQLNQNDLPKTYFDLIEKVNSKGPYQRNIFIISFFVFFTSGMLSLGTGFLFMNFEFNCGDQGLLTQQCSKNICELPERQWEKYIVNPPKIDSVATDFGPFYCGDEIVLSLIQASVYLGILFGLLTFLYITDNYGRKFSIVLAWGFTSFGCVVLSLSTNIVMVAVGSFFAGMGSEASMRIVLSIINEITQYFLRQKYCILASVGYALAGAFIGVIYFVIPDWRINIIAFVAVPAVLCQGFLIFYLQQTPKYLIRKKIDEALKAFDKISQINMKMKGVVTQEDIRNVIQEQVDESQFNQKITPIDMFRFPSLRLKTICLSLTFFVINYLYLGPILGISAIGIDPFISQIMLSVAELLTYPFSFSVIQKLPRRNSGIVLFGISIVATTILIFVDKPADCNICFQSILELTLASVSRLCCAVYYAILFIYVLQLYPQRARGQGLGVASTLNAVAAISGTIIINFFNRNGISSYIFFTFCAIIGIANLLFLQETKGKPLQVEIQEIQIKKDKIKTIRIKQKTEYQNMSSIKFEQKKGH